ncbi:MAG: M13-type metalloendopeptidase [Thermoguttaceae bacterium]|jgi:putative endopeptidase
MRTNCLLALVPTFTLLAACAAEGQAAQPLASGIDRANFDPSVRFQDDLFHAVNGAWLAKTEIPADRADYGAFTALAEQAEKDVRAIVESCAGAGHNAADPEKKIGDLYASYMDEARAERLGITPIAGTLAAIDSIQTKAGLVRMLAELARVGISGAVDCSIAPDAKQSDRYILHLSQAGLGLPDRDYYWDAKYKEKLAAYEAHVARSLALCGVVNARRAAAQIVAFETRLARAHWSKEDNRDNVKTYNKRTREGLLRLAPGLDWNLYFETVGAGAAEELIVAQPSYLTAVAGLADSAPLGIWKAWLKWKVVHEHAGLLNRALVDADFAFYGGTLRGIPRIRPRWKRAVAAVEGGLGEAVGKLYVARHFPPDAKLRMDAMVKNIIAAYGQAVRELDWMGPSTKQKALAKLAAFDPKIGYPKKWRDYSALVIRRDDLVGNLQRAAAFEWNRRLARLGKPVDRDEWFMTPQTVNAYYNPSMNAIVFPAAILQPPFFNRAAADAVNYGGIGAVIGHETGHGFDDQGSKWDGAGNLADWWTAADRAEFDRRGAALAAQFDRFEPLPGYKVNGRFTLGENSADLAGLTISYAAYRRALGGREAPVLDGLSGDQRFFIGWAQVWRRKHRVDDLKTRLLIDPHSPAEYRVNGTVRNLPAFYSAFGVKPGDKMYLPPNERVKIW